MIPFFFLHPRSSFYFQRWVAAATNKGHGATPPPPPPPPPPPGKRAQSTPKNFEKKKKKRAPEKNATFLFNRFCFSFFFRFGVGCCRQRSPSDTTATAAVVVPKSVKKGEKKVTFPLRSSAQFDVDGRRRSTRISTTRTARPKKTKRKTNGRDAKGQRKRTPVMKEEHKRKTKKEPAKSINFN